MSEMPNHSVSIDSLPPCPAASVTSAVLPRRARVDSTRQPDPAAAALGREVLLQQTALAGFRHHAALRLWPALRRRALLRLVREPDNRHDANAVALYWRGEKLGYLPRRENLVAARLLDRQRQLSARVERLAADGDSNQRVRLAVWMVR